MNRSASRPWTVALGCAVSFAISVWDLVSSFPDDEIVESHGFLALVLALSIVPVIFTLAAFFRRNWARIVLAVLTALSFVSVPLFAFFSEEAAGPLDTETVLYAIAEVIVVVLLFAPASNDWYRRYPAPISAREVEPGS
jgi:peptidoglycan/LPS O-acetylase OafA/YrhL